jgi:hypothetical protein
MVLATGYLWWLIYGCIVGMRKAFMLELWKHTGNNQFDR